MIVIALFTALIAPYYIDWGSYKQDFERETTRIIGQEVKVNGETSVRILPVPSVTFEGLSVGESEDGTPLMTVDQFEMDVELMPILRGIVQIVRLNLVRPKINIELSKSGELTFLNRQKLLVDPDQIKLDNFTITNGAVNIKGLTGGRTLALEQLDGRISAKSLYGPWRIGVDGYVGSKRARFDLVTGRLQDDQSIRLKLTAKRADLPYRLALDGPVTMAKGLFDWKGEYELNAIRDKETGAQKALPISSEGEFRIQPHKIDVPKYRMEVGSRDDPYTILGSGSADIGKTVEFSVKADGRQINLDRIGKKKTLQIEGVEHELNVPTLGERLSVVRELVDKIPVPEANGIIDVKLPAIVAGDTFIRDVTARISPDGSGWNVQNFVATFPGNTKLEAKGKVGLGSDFGFTGDLLVASRQPTGLASWLGRRNNAFIRKLHSAGFSADVVISDYQTSLNNLELVLDAAVLRGKLQRLAGNNNNNPAIVVGLKGEKINLDDLRAIYSLAVEENSTTIADHDLDVSLQADELKGFDLSAEKLDARFRISGESVSVQRLNATNLFGATLNSSGHIEDLFKQPNGQFKLSVKAKQAAPLLGYLDAKLPGYRLLHNLARSPSLTNDLDLNLVINSRSSSLDASAGSKGQAFIQGSLGDTELDIQTTFEGQLDKPDAFKIDISPTLENPDPAKLLMQLGLAVLPVEVNGPLKITGTFGGDPRKEFAGYLTAQMADSNLRLEGSAVLTGSSKGDALFTLSQSSKDIAPLMYLSGLVLPSLALDARQIPTSFTGELELVKNRIVLHKGQGQIGGHDFNLNLDFATNTSSNHRISGKLAANRIDLPLLAGTALTSLPDAGLDQRALWSKTNFGLPLLRGIDGEIDLAIKQSDFGLGDAATEISGKLALVDGSFNLNDVKGKWLGGSFETNLSLTNAEGMGNLSSQFKISDIDLKVLSQAIESKNFASGMMNLLGDLEGSGRSPAAIVASLTGSGTIDLKNVEIDGINTNPLQHVFAMVDQEDFQILDENVLPVISEVIDRGNISVKEVSVPYIVAVGVLRARNIAFDADQSDMVGAIELDLKDRSVKSGLSVGFDPGKEWVEGADPKVDLSWSGDLSDPKLSIDVQPLSGYLSLRAFEREQRRVDLLQASILEKQRLRRDIIVTNARVRYRQKLREEELRRQRQAFLAKEEELLLLRGAERHERLLNVERIAIEKKRREEEEAAKRKREEEARRKREAREKELARIAEEKRKKEEARKAREEKERLERERAAKLAAEERKRKQEQTRLEQIEEQRKKEQAAQRKLLEERRKAQEAQRIAEEEKKKAEEARRLAEAEEQKRKDEQARLEEAKRIQQQLDADNSNEINLVGPTIKKPQKKVVPRKRKPRIVRKQRKNVFGTNDEHEGR